MSPDNVIPLAILLRPNARTPDTRQRVVEEAQRLGLKVTGTGLASISCRASVNLCKKLFGQVPSRVKARPPQRGDHGSSGGWEEMEFPVPPSLEAYVVQIVVLPPPSRLL